MKRKFVVVLKLKGKKIIKSYFINDWVEYQFLGLCEPSKDYTTFELVKNSSLGKSLRVVL